MRISEDLRHLQTHLVDEFNKGKKMQDLYEMVQYAGTHSRSFQFLPLLHPYLSPAHSGNIVPRLYLLVTVGAVFIRTQTAPARPVLKDLIEMCRGVQHPLHGLFLRNHLLQAVKADLPEGIEPYDIMPTHLQLC